MHTHNFVTYEEFGRKFFEVAVTADRVADGFGTMAGDTFELGPFPAGPAGIARVTHEACLAGPTVQEAQVLPLMGPPRAAGAGVAVGEIRRLDGAAPPVPFLTVAQEGEAGRISEAKGREEEWLSLFLVRHQEATERGATFLQSPEMSNILERDRAMLFEAIRPEAEDAMLAAIMPTLVGFAATGAASSPPPSGSMARKPIRCSTSAPTNMRRRSANCAASSASRSSPTGAACSSARMSSSG